MRRSRRLRPRWARLVGETWWLNWSWGDRVRGGVGKNCVPVGLGPGDGGSPGQPPIVPPAPDRFSIIIDWPSLPDSCSNTVCGTMSEALPAVNGTIARIGSVGHVCPNAEAFTAMAA